MMFIQMLEYNFISLSSECLSSNKILFSFILNGFFFLFFFYFLLIYLFFLQDPDHYLNNSIKMSIN